MAIVLTAFAPVVIAQELSARLDPSTRRLEISVTGLRENGYALQIETPGVREIETGSDVNEPGIIYLPPAEGRVSLTAKPIIPAGAENIFFFNDFVEARNWQLVVRFPSDLRGTWKLNGRFSRLGGELRRELTMPVIELERGENMLHVRAENTARPHLWFRRAIPGGDRFAETVTVGHADWSGRISLVKEAPSREPVSVAHASVVGRAPARHDLRIGERWWEERDAVAAAALAVGRNLLHAQVSDPRSLFAGGFNLVYDPQRQAYRMPHWLWAWGPSIKLLFELEKLPAAKTTQLAARFRAAAIAAGRRSLAFEMTEPTHPAHGISTVRWEPSRAASNGWVEYLSTADSLFLAGWGWMSCHAVTRDPIFLERTKSLVLAAERLMRQYPVVPQDWVVERGRWTPHTLDESVFGMIGFRELHAATQSQAVAQTGARFLDSHLEHMGRESGLLERAWLREENRAIWDPDIKGHAWVIEGYLDAYGLSGDPKYLGLARTLAQRVMECQPEDGAWTYLFKKPEAGDPRDDKGTAIWAYLFYRVYRTTGDTRHLAAARRALGWCLRHQYRGENPHLDGGLLNTNAMAYVRRRPMTILYSTTFLGLALLEELALAPKP